MIDESVSFGFVVFSLNSISEVYNGLGQHIWGLVFKVVSTDIDGFCGGCYPPPNISYNPPKQNVHPSKKIFSPSPPIFGIIKNN